MTNIREREVPTDVPMTGEWIDELSKYPIAELFPDFIENINNGLCTTCGKPVKGEDLVKIIERKEYNLSGMCHDCQKEFFS